MIKFFLSKSSYIKQALKITPFLSCFIILLNILTNCTPALKILFIGKLIEDIRNISAFEKSALFVDLLLVLLVYLFEYLAGVFQSIAYYRFSIVVNTAMEDHFYSKLSAIKYSVLEDNDSNELIDRVKEGINTRFPLGFSKTLELVGLVIKFISILAVVATGSLLPSFVLAIVFLCLLPLYRKLGSDNYEAFADANSEYRRARSYRMMLTEKEFANEREIYSYGDFLGNKWKKHYDSAIDKELKASRKNHFMILVVTGCTALLTTLLSGILVPSVVAGKLILGDFIITVTQLYNLVHFMSWNYSYLVDDLQENALYFRDYSAFSELAEIPTEKETGTIRIKQDSPLEIKIENLTFCYPGSDVPVIKNFTYTFHNGKHYAIVGKNGAGKSTLVKLMLGLYDEYAGKILINGVDVRNLSIQTLKAVFSVVFQDYPKYGMSVIDNVLLDKPVDEASIRKAKDLLDQLGILSEINKLDKGIFTTLGKIDSEGVDLSGGQWQKLAIARGAISDAEIMVFDEPTSALDPISEKKLYQMYNSVFADRTTIVITHRLGNTQNQDEIVVIDDGMLAEHGDYQTLMDKKALFFEMYTKQRGWYDESYA